MGGNPPRLASRAACVLSAWRGRAASLAPAGTRRRRRKVELVAYVFEAVQAR